MAPDPDRDLDFTGVTILVVDDNQYMRELIRNMLRAFDTGTVLVACNAKEAMTQMSHRDVDCLIVDWLMPGMSGIELVRQIRTSPKSPKPDVPIVLCSGHTEQERVLEARDAGVSEILTKPLSPRALLEKLTAAIVHPRPFIISPNYTGPDRRRRSNPNYNGIERRKSVGLDQGDIDALLHDG